MAELVAGFGIIANYNSYFIYCFHTTQEYFCTCTHKKNNAHDSDTNISSQKQEATEVYLTLTRLLQTIAIRLKSHTSNKMNQ